MDIRKWRVRRIRPEDPDWGTMKAFTYPWLIFPPEEARVGIPFRNHSAALSFVLSCLEER
jgi:hypothetical protein